jgi:hypothetical protein
MTLGMTLERWEAEIAVFWARFDEDPTDGWDVVEQLDSIAALCPAADGRADFERACIRDSTGHTDLAVGFYESGMTAGLDDVRRSRTLVQMASSRRGLGHVDEAIDILSSADLHSLGGAPSLVLALALRDAGRHDEALRVAIEAVIPHLPRYQRSMANYARLLTESD